MKYLVVIIGAIILYVAQPGLFVYTIPFWVVGLTMLYSHKRTEEYKILERIDGFGTTYIPVLVQHNTLLWWKWDRYGFVHQEFIDENPVKCTYFDGAKFVIEEYKQFLEKSKVKVELHEKSLS